MAFIAGAHDDGGWIRITRVADADTTISPGLVTVVFVVESRSPTRVVTLFWCSIVPSGSVIVLSVVVVGPCSIETVSSQTLQTDIERPLPILIVLFHQD